MEGPGSLPGDHAGNDHGGAPGWRGQLAEALGPSGPGGSGEPPPGDEDLPGGDRPVDAEAGVRAAERYYVLDGVVFRIRLDRLDSGAQYLRNERWVWTPITSGGVIDNPHARELSPEAAQKYRTSGPAEPEEGGEA